jgi:hypothetical protein
VLRQLFNTFGNPAAVQAAVEAAMPDLDRQRQLEERKAVVAAGLKKVQDGRQHVLGLVMQGKTTEAEAASVLEDSKAKVTKWEDELHQLDASLVNVPTAGEVKAAANRVSKAFVRMNARIGVANTDFSRMTWQQKRELVQQVFSGKTLEGQRMGVYLERTGAEVRYTIRGHFTQLSGTLPMTAEEAKRLTDPDYVSADLQEHLVTKCAWRSSGPGPRGCRSRPGTPRPRA